MAKNFNTSAADILFTAPQSTKVDPQEEKTNQSASAVVTSSAVVEPTHPAETIESSSNTKNNKNSFSVEMTVKQKRDFRVSVAVNPDDYKLFGEACAKLGIKKNDAMNQLIKQFTNSTLG